jgi:hypothetical protein
LEPGSGAVAVDDLIEILDRRPVGGPAGEQIMVAGAGVEQAQDFAEVRIGILLRQRGATAVDARDIAAAIWSSWVCACVST